MPNFFRNVLSVLTAAITLLGASCNKEAQTPDKPTVAVQSKTNLIFPDQLRVDDATVNTFVRSALTQCASSDYEAFRSLWTAKQEPISKAEFSEGWDAVRRIEVRALEKVLLAMGDDGKTTEPVYVLLAEVELDAAARVGKREPIREIVLMLVREHDQWRLAGAPKEMREWVKSKLAANPTDLANPTTNEPPSKSP